MSYFPLIITVFLCFQIAVCIFYTGAGFSYFGLYRKKKNPDYPLFANELYEYLNKNPKYLFKIFLTTFFMWKIIFESHKDKELDKLAQRVRFFIFLFFGSIILEFFLIFIITSNLK